MGPRPFPAMNARPSDHEPEHRSPAPPQAAGEPPLRIERRTGIRPVPDATDRREARLRVAGRIGVTLGAIVVGVLFVTLGASRALLAAVALLAGVEASHTAELRRRPRALAQLTRLDDLTGLGNARALWNDLPVVVTAGPMALMIADVDRFKQINDELGHSAGDAALRHAAALLSEVVASAGSCYRYGGDELVALLPGADEYRAAAIAETLRARIAEPAIGLPTITTSVGVAAATPGAGAHQVLDRADRALRQAKSEGRDRVIRSSATGADSGEELVARAARRAALAMASVAADAHYPEAATQSEEIVLLCQAIADQLGIRGEDREHILAAARLHDVGKAGVPSEILRKPGPLDPSEWAIMHEHTVMGQRILESVPELADVAPIVRHAQERWDGTGYPDRLAGEEIPLASRVILCAGAFQAMRSDRPYRGPRAIDDALAEIRANAGTQFDPAVAQALIDVIAASGARRRGLLSRLLAR